MAFEMTNKNRFITVYNLSADTCEFIGKGDAYIPANTGLPAYCINIAPPAAPEGILPVFNFQTYEWVLLEDHRGAIVYDINTGDEIRINKLGAFPVDVVFIAPDGNYSKWDGDKWVRDEAAESAAMKMQNEQEKQTLLALVASQIAPLQDAVDLDIATDSEKELLLALKKYRVMLNRVDVSDPEWPEKPQ
ncbi:tail fiber assembly protein [Kluyvera intermedia]|uniref:Tail fiber assembly protein n=1 Tax=Kluyvera intermedia TaxID=61648 RepID=A0AA95G466_KLUIN|nr:tail fiber assembly protein [Kluyvera intermedia]WGL57676.1 tail fiber assembly protein [Kluyvera intermedia]